MTVCQPVLAVPMQRSHPADAIVSTRPLGALYTPQATTFRVYAPTARSVTLHLYGVPEGGSATNLAMRANKKDGTFAVTVSGDCRGRFYTLSASGDDPGFHPDRELLDPYAHAVTAADGRGIVVHDETPVAPRPTFPPQDAIICEIHVRDLTIDRKSGVTCRGQYLGVAESGTHLQGHADVTTALDHLVELGVNTVQIMPVMQYLGGPPGHYGWGYDALHYNAPHVGYATTSRHASAVAEVKHMVDALHRRGLRVVLDAVYNHTVEDIRHRVYSFEGLVPGYYYRRKPDGTYWNGSGCGNEFRSEAPMARRFIIDSTRYWVTEYGADGFRFDLMGLIDLDTMRALTLALHQIDPNLLIYGEPWAAGDTPIAITAKGSQRGLGFAVFNDTFRDALKGSVFHARERGFVQEGSHSDAIRRGIMGSLDDFAASPCETINYVECHDNHTFWDRLKNSTSDLPGVTDADRCAMDRLGAAILFTSQGIPFFQCGQEMLRTKKGDDNSYDKPDSVNMIRWEWKRTHADMVAWYRGLITLRRQHSLFRLATADAVRTAVRFLECAPPTLAWEITDPTGQDSWGRALVICNPNAIPSTFVPPPGHWLMYADGTRASGSPLTAAPQSTVEVPAWSACVLGEPRQPAQ